MDPTAASPLSRLLLSLPKPTMKVPPSSHSPPSRNAVAAKNTPGVVLVLRRREAVAAVLSAAILSRVVPAVAEASGGECPLEVAPNGLAFCDRVVGTGAAAEQGQLIKAHYTGRLEDGTVFDSSYKRGKPLTFRVGVGEVIKGWDQGIVGGEGIPPMLAGGKRTLRLPPELAYGARGAGCRGWEPTSCVIPPNSTLLFDVETQDMLKSKLILEDDFGWNLPSMGSNSEQSNTKGNLKYIGGVDISFLKEDPSTACAALVVLDAGTLKVVHEEFDVVRLQVPYIPGFLAFREAPILLGLLEKMKANTTHFYPQVLMVDGNGLLHPRGFGLACHVGVLADLPTIGVGKNLHHVDGLNQSEVRRQLEAKENCNKELFLLTGQSGTTWGAAMRSCPGSSKPIYISVGHRISLDSAIGVVKFCSNYRIPEPIRQ
ncbi:hypothetical protein E2562_038606, partial [Oryza meyeriana var. granulata]